MDKVPAVGGARGIFEIFVPGLFLLLNAIATFYFLPCTSQETRDQLAALSAHPLLVFLVVVPFGYLAGVVLRLFRSDVSDRASARFLRLYHQDAWGGQTAENHYAYEAFPYPKWLEVLVHCRFPSVAGDFFDSVWADRANDKQFVNFCKVLVSAEDALAATEIYSAESLSRYISGMFYALAAACTMVVLLIVSRLLGGKGLEIGLLSLAAAYVVGMLTILANFRFVRVKEVETIFAASFKNRHLFVAKEGLDTTTTDVPGDRLHRPAG